MSWVSSSICWFYFNLGLFAILYILWKKIWQWFSSSLKAVASIYWVSLPGAAWSTLHIWSHLRLMATLWGYYHYFSDQKLSRKVKYCPHNHPSGKWLLQDLNPDLSDNHVHAPNMLVCIRWFHSVDTALGHHREEMNLLPPQLSSWLMSLKFYSAFSLVADTNNKMRHTLPPPPTCYRSHITLCCVIQQVKAPVLVSTFFWSLLLRSSLKPLSSRTFLLHISLSQQAPYDSCRAMREESGKSVDLEFGQTLFKPKRSVADWLLDN